VAMAYFSMLSQHLLERVKKNLSEKLASTLGLNTGSC
jgi:hypothetical protein